MEPGGLVLYSQEAASGLFTAPRESLPEPF